MSAKKLLSCTQVDTHIVREHVDPSLGGPGFDEADDLLGRLYCLQRLAKQLLLTSKERKALEVVAAVTVAGLALEEASFRDEELVASDERDIVAREQISGLEASFLTSGDQDSTLLVRV